MPYLIKLNPNATDQQFNIPKQEAGCCDGTETCGYAATVPVAGLTGVTFTNYEGVSTVATFENVPTDAASFKTEMHKLFLKSQSDGGLGAFESEAGGITATDNGTDIDIQLITDITIELIGATAPTEDCVAERVCDCQFTVGIGMDVSAVDLVVDGGAAQQLATGTYNAGDGATLQADVNTAATAAGATVTAVAVTEDTASGTFVVKVSHKGGCDSLLWNGATSTNCGCKQAYNV